MPFVTVQQPQDKPQDKASLQELQHRQINLAPEAEVETFADALKPGVAGNCTYILHVVGTHHHRTTAGTRNHQVPGMVVACESNVQGILP